MKLAIKLIIEFTPLGLFFVLSPLYGPRVGTAVFVVATVISVALMRYLYDQVAMMALITAATGLIAGVVAVVLNDPSYFQMKPTIVCLVFAVTLAAGLALELPLFQSMLGQELHITDQGWRVLTWLWLGYFVFVAVSNEYLRREFSFNTWLEFKAFGLMPLTILFAIPQKLLLNRYKRDCLDLDESELVPLAEPLPAMSLLEPVEMFARADEAQQFAERD